MDFSFPWSEEEKPKDGVYFTTKNTELKELIGENFYLSSFVLLSLLMPFLSLF